LLKKSVTIPRAVRIVREVAEATSEAHRMGIVHRDIKPSNIAISNGDTVRVLDFGLAKRIGIEAVEITADRDQSGANTRTSDGVIVGTPMYLSPEQALGSEIDLRSDQHSKTLRPRAFALRSCQNGLIPCL
jgi:serine/threonine protein kinase